MSCPLCKAGDYTLIFPQPGGVSKVVKCAACFHIYTINQEEPDPVAIHSDRQYEVIENRNTLSDRILKWEYHRVLNKIDHLISVPGYLLDFGCGKGLFPYIAQQKGWKVKAVETSPDRAEYARRTYGIDVNSNLYVSGKLFPMRFDVISFLHVLEHLPDPKNLLSTLLKANLVKGGLIVIEVPNFNSLQRKIAGRHWHHLDFPRHINHFTPGILRKLGEDMGLRLTGRNNFSFYLGVLGMIDSLLKLFGYRKNIIYELKYRRPKMLILSMFLLLPFAFMLEGIAAVFGNGGIIRYYFKETA